MTELSPIRIGPHRQPLGPIKSAKNFVIVTAPAKDASIASTMEVVCPTRMRSRIDSTTTRGLGRRTTLTELRPVSGGRGHGRVAVGVEKAVCSCSGRRGSQRQVAKFECGGFCLFAEAAAHD